VTNLSKDLVFLLQLICTYWIRRAVL